MRQQRLSASFGSLVLLRRNFFDQASLSQKPYCPSGAVSDVGRPAAGNQRNLVLWRKIEFSDHRLCSQAASRRRRCRHGENWPEHAFEAWNVHEFGPPLVRGGRRRIVTSAKP